MSALQLRAEYAACDARYLCRFHAAERRCFTPRCHAAAPRRLRLPQTRYRRLFAFADCPRRRRRMPLRHAMPPAARCLLCATFAAAAAAAAMPLHAPPCRHAAAFILPRHVCRARSADRRLSRCVLPFDAAPRCQDKPRLRRRYFMKTSPRCRFHISRQPIYAALRRRTPSTPRRGCLFEAAVRRAAPLPAAASQSLPSV